MKKILILIALICFVVRSFSQGGDPLAKVKFDEIIIDFGQLREVDGEVDGEFRYTNIGEIPFVIYNISTSCGCTTPDYDRSPLLKGDSRTLKVTFDPTNQPGRVEKVIFVRGNIANGMIALKIRAHVEPAPRGIEDDYPVLLSAGVRLADAVMELGQTVNSKSSTHTLALVNTSSETVALEFDDKVNVPSWVDISFSKNSLSSGEKGELIVNLNPQNASEPLWGQQAFVVPLTINKRSQYNNPSARLTFVEDFSNFPTENPPKARVNNSFHHFSTVEVGDKLVHKFVLENLGESILNVRHLDHSSRIKSSISSPSVSKGSPSVITLELDSSSEGPRSEIIRVISSDPIRPVIELRLMANIVE